MAGEETQAHAEAMRRALARAAGDLAPDLLASGQALVAAWRRLEPHLRAAYGEAGQPYGPSDEGLWRWLGEAGVIETARTEADLQATWRQVLERLPGRPDTG